MLTSPAPLAALVGHAVETAPEAVAVRAHDGCLTYRELSDRADRLARELIRRGAARRDLVGLCLDRSAALVVAALGIMRAGCAYVAVDPRYPDERVRWMLED